MDNKSSFRANPFLKIAFPFVIGILLVWKVPFPEQSKFIFPALSLFLLTTAIVLGSKALGYTNRWIPGAILMGAWLFLAMAITISKKAQNSTDTLSETPTTYLGWICDPIAKGSNSLKVKVQLEGAINNDTVVAHTEKILLYISKDMDPHSLKYGDRLLFCATLQKVQNKGNPGEFDYALFLKKEGINRTGFVNSKDVKRLPGFKGKWITSRALALRTHLLETYKKHNLYGQELAIVSALTLGYKEDLSTPTRKAFSDSGAMHVLAVSGLHVGILQLVLNYLLVFFDRNKKLKIVKSLLIILLLWAYALLTGLSPSVVRAALMFSFIQVGISLRRDISIFNIVAISALLVLLIDPLLLFNIGFQFSYLALLGILYIHPKLYPLIKSKHWLIDKAWALVVASFAAQLSLGPLSSYYFGQFPNYFLLTNLVVIPWAFALIVTALALFLASPLNVLAGFVANVLQLLSHALIWCLKFIQDLPGSTSQAISLTGFEMVAWYVLIAIAIAFFILKNKQLLLVFLGGIALLFAFSFSTTEIHNRKANGMVFNITGSSAIYLNHGTGTHMLCDSSLYRDKEKKGFLFEKFFRDQRQSGVRFINIDSLHKEGALGYYGQLDKCRFLVISDERLKHLNSKQSLRVDYLILRNSPRLSIQHLNSLFTFRELIFDSSNKTWLVKQWQEECNKLGISYFSTKNKGAKSLIEKP